MALSLLLYILPEAAEIIRQNAIAECCHPTSFSRRGAKAQRRILVSTLRLCAFARKRYHDFWFGDAH
jgi:hypothetical protein